MVELVVTSNFSGSSDNTPNTTVPAGGEVGDCFILGFKVRNDITMTSWPAGFLEETSLTPNEATLGSRIRVALRDCDETESGTFTGEASAYYPWTGMCVLLKGITSTTLVDSDFAGTFAGFLAEVDLPAGTITIPGSGTYVAVWMGASTSGDSTDVATQTPPTGFTTPSGGSIEPYTDNTHHVAFLDGITTPGDISPIGTHTWGSAASRSALGIVLLFEENSSGGALDIEDQAPIPMAGALSIAGDIQILSALNLAAAQAIALAGALSIAGDVQIAAGNAQFCAPTSDVADGSWFPSSGTDLYPMLDELDPSDADYISTATPGDVCTVGLATAVDPEVSTGHVVSYRIMGNGSSGLQVSLMQSATPIASWTHDPAPTDWTTYVQTLSTGEADAITDYAALRLRFTEV